MNRDQTIALALAGLSEVIDPGNQNLEVVVIEKDAKGRRVVVPLNNDQITESLAARSTVISGNNEGVDIDMTA